MLYLLLEKSRIVAIAALGAAMLTQPVWAHAHLDHASPATGSTVTQAPKDVTIWFTEALEPKFSGIDVRDAQGASVAGGEATLDPGNTAELRVPLEALPPGTYKVIWHVMSVDTHRTQGEFSFTVGK